MAIHWETNFANHINLHLSPDVTEFEVIELISTCTHSRLHAPNLIKVGGLLLAEDSYIFAPNLKSINMLFPIGNSNSLFAPKLPKDVFDKAIERGKNWTGLSSDYSFKGESKEAL